MGLQKNKKSKSGTTKSNANVMAELQAANFQMEELLKGFEERDAQAIFNQIPVLEAAYLKAIAKITFSQEEINITEGIDEAEMARLNIEDAKLFLRNNLRLD
jgi:hypothetical protein